MNIFNLGNVWGLYVHPATSTYSAIDLSFVDSDFLMNINGPSTKSSVEVNNFPSLLNP